jgi:hypothetical protein
MREPGVQHSFYESGDRSGKIKGLRKATTPASFGGKAVEDIRGMDS